MHAVTLHENLNKINEIQDFGVVPRTGLEPVHLAASAPEADASTNFATWAHKLSLRIEETHIIAISEKKFVEIKKNAPSENRP